MLINDFGKWIKENDFMFEVFVTVCLIKVADVCTDVLIPGGIQETMQSCQTSMIERHQQWQQQLKDEYIIESPKCVPRPETKLSFDEVAEGVFVQRGLISDLISSSRGNISNIGFVVGEESIAIIDSGGSRWVGEQIYLAVRAVSNLPISHIILTHMHPDHVYGASVFAEAAAKVVGHTKLTRSLADREDSYRTSYHRLLDPEDLIAARFVQTDIQVAEEMVIDLGNRRLQLNAWELAHSNSDLTILDLKSKILFTGDLVFDGWLPVVDGSLRGWQSVMEEIRDWPVEMIIPGHGGPILPWPAGEKNQTRYFEVLEKDTRDALNKGLSLNDAAKEIGFEEATRWELFELFNERNAISVFTELEWE